MSRAFTKEDDAGEDLPERPVPAGPNYVTPRGLDQLKTAGQELADKKARTVAEGGDVKPIDRDLRYLESRINSAIVVPKGTGPEVRFGARVTIVDDAGETQTFQLVGDDEARTDSLYLSWSSPLALAMMGAKAGESISWDGPDGPIRRKIVDVTYP